MGWGQKQPPGLLRRQSLLAACAHFDFHAETLSLPGASNMTAAKGQAMSDRLLFSMGGASMIFALTALAMLWPV